nr:sensor histidine kinase [Pelagicoccus albus]
MLQTWSGKDGLSNRIINQIGQDADGYLWLATMGGLIRFDGTNYREFKIPPQHQPRGYNIRTLVSSPQGKLLLQPTSGRILFREDGQIEEHASSATIIPEQPREMFYAADESLWISTESGSILRWTPQNSQWFGTDTTPKRKINASFAQDSSGGSWINTSSCFGIYKDDRWSTPEIDLGKPILIGQGTNGEILLFAEDALYTYQDARLRMLSNQVPWQDNPGELYEAITDKWGTIWIAAGKLGLIHWEEGRFLPAPENFPFVNDLTLDKSGNIWAASYGNGLGKVTKRSTTLLNRSSGLRSEISSSIYQDSDQNIWIANGDGGVYRIQNDKPVSTNTLFQDSLLAANTVSIDHEKQLWIGNEQGLFVSAFPYKVAEKIQDVPKNVHILHVSSDNKIWFATNFGRFGHSNTPATFGHIEGGEIVFFDDGAGYDGKPIQSLAESYDGEMWAGTYTGFLFRVTNDRVELIHQQSSIPDLHFDSESRLWIASITDTLILENGTVHSLQNNSNYRDKGVPSILDDQDGNIWLGLNRFRLEQLREKVLTGQPAPIPENFNRITRDLDLSILVNSHPFSQMDRDGRLWFTTSKGVLILDPKALPERAESPVVLIDSVSINGDTVATDIHAHTIPAGPHSIRIEFSSPNLSNLSRSYIRQRLLGAGKEWEDASYTDTLHYSGLAPGEYRLELQAGSPAGWKTPATTLAFEVLPPWWQTIWFRVLGLTGAIAFVAIFIWIWTQRRMQAQLAKLEQDQALERERARIARDLHDDLGGGLSALQLFASRLAEEPESKRSKSLAQLAERARRLNADVHSIVWLFKPGEGTLQELAELIEQYAAEIFKGSTIDCRLSDPGTLPSVPLTPEAQHNLFFAAKEALTNSLKHANATKISVELSYKDSTLNCILKDDGIGLPAPADQQRRRNGLINMQIRMREIGGKIDFHSDPQTGTQITITYQISDPNHVD